MQFVLEFGISQRCLWNWKHTNLYVYLSQNVCVFFKFILTIWYCVIFKQLIEPCNSDHISIYFPSCAGRETEESQEHVQVDSPPLFPRSWTWIKPASLNEPELGPEGWRELSWISSRLFLNSLWCLKSSLCFTKMWSLDLRTDYASGMEGVSYVSYRECRFKTYSSQAN